MRMDLDYSPFNRLGLLALFVTQDGGDPGGGGGGGDPKPADPKPEDKKPAGGDDLTAKLLGMFESQGKVLADLTARLDALAKPADPKPEDKKPADPKPGDDATAELLRRLEEQSKASEALKARLDAQDLKGKDDRRLGLLRGRKIDPAYESDAVKALQHADPDTAEGRKAIEDWAQARPKLFEPAGPPPPKMPEVDPKKVSPLQAAIISRLAAAARRGRSA